MVDGSVKIDRKINNKKLEKVKGQAKMLSDNFEEVEGQAKMLPASNLMMSFSGSGIAMPMAAA